MGMIQLTKGDKITLTKIGNGFLDRYTFQAKHNDDQTEEHIFHSHGNALSVEAENT